MTSRLLRLALWVTIGFLAAGCTAPSSQYVGSATCGSCHTAVFAAWEASDHQKAMQIPSSESVLAAFDGEKFDHYGDEYRFVRSDSSYLVLVSRSSEKNDAGKVDTFKVAYTFGHIPLQQYLLPTHKGRLQALTVAWDTKKESWFSLYPDEATPEGDVLHWKSSNLNWNYMCADCHSTGLKRGFDVATDTYNTTWDERTVGCEACHGPGSDHVSSKSRDPYSMPMKATVIPGVGRPSTVDLELELNTCARCHSRRVTLTESFDHNQSYLDQFGPSLLRDSLYYDDGQIKDEVYVYGSFLQSKMAQKGVTCSDCHDPHTAKLRLEGNALCASCHDGATYDTKTHTGHETVTSCVTCHMPETTYMGVDPRRDHRFGIPNPAIAELSGSPDVCASCHPKRNVNWIATDESVIKASELYPRAVAALKQAAQQAALNQAATNQAAPNQAAPSALQQVETALKNNEVSAFQKGSLVARLASFQDGEALRLVLLQLKAASPFQRVGALQALAGWAGRVPAPDLSSVLADSLKWVRMEAVATALAFGETNWNEDGLAAVLQEYVLSQNSVAERPEAHVNLGRMYESLLQYQQAENEFNLAVRLDSVGSSWWLERAMFLGRKANRLQATRQPGLDQNTRQAAETEVRTTRIEAEKSFGKAVQLAGPMRSDVLYLFGLFLGEDPVRLPDAALLLKESAKGDPTNARKAYNAGIAHQQLGFKTEAEALLNQASALGMVEADDGLVIFYMQNERWEEAQQLNERLMSRFPNRRDLQERNQFIQGAQQPIMKLP